MSEIFINGWLLELIDCLNPSTQQDILNNIVNNKLNNMNEFVVGSLRKKEI